LFDSGLNWYRTIVEILLDMGYRRTSDQCLFFNPGAPNRPLFGINVDDGALVARKQEDVQEFVDELHRRGIHKVTQQGVIHSYLNISIKRLKNPDRFELNQTQFLTRALTKMGLIQSRTVSIPMCPKASWKKDNGDDKQVPPDRSFASALNKIGYAVKTRWDIAVAVAKLGQAQSAPTAYHHGLLRKLCQYLASTIDDKLVVRPFTADGSVPTIRVATDADLDGNKVFYDDATARRSRSGYIVYVGDAPVRQRTSLQSITAISTQESEFIALLEGALVGLFQQQLLQDIGLDATQPELYCDCKPAVSIAESVIPRDMVRHVALKFARLRELTQMDKVRIKEIHTTRNPADLQTKSVGLQILRRLKPMMMGCEPIDWTRAHLAADALGQ